jgi:hypothetical protein
MSNRIPGKSIVLLVKASLVSLLTETIHCAHDTYETRYGVPIIIDLEEVDDRELRL